MTIEYRTMLVALVFALGFSLSGCDSASTASEPDGRLTTAALEGVYEFAAPVYDIDAAPDGSILVAEGTTIKEIRRGGVQEVVRIPTVLDSAITGLAAIGRGNFFATSGRLFDQDETADLWRVSRGGARLVADIGEFDTEHDPDAFAGPQWKDQACEVVPPFLGGAQSDPYHLEALSGGEALVADAAGNTLLSVGTQGDIDWVAVFTPPLDENGEWRVLPLDVDTVCYVEPVPTSVAVGPDGAYYVGELTGATPDPADALGLARIWRIEAGSRNVVCPSDACREVVSGLTAVIDVAFGPDGRLYAVEFDANGWLAALSGDAAGGTIKSCDVDTGECDLVEDGLVLPGAITFDKWGNLWVLENGIFAPTVRAVLP